MLSALYACLFALSIVLINPWGNDPDPLGTNRTEIWTHPKIFVVFIIVCLNFGFILIHLWKRKSLSFISSWKIASGFWVLYLGAATISTLLSPFPLHSFWGHTITSDGLLYWILIAGFVLSNALVLQIKPTLLHAQLYGFLFGGVALSISIFPQLADWRVDYTATSGRISDLDPGLLVSGVWKEHTPIGLYSNRGYAAFVLAGIICLSLVSTLRQWIKSSLGWSLCALASVALLCTQNRAGMLALVAGVIYLIIFYQNQIRISRNILTFFLISLLSFLGYGIYRAFITLPINRIQVLTSHNILEGSLTGRIYLWMLSLKGIAERPFWGWGFNGFGIAHLFVADWSGKLRSYVPEQPKIAKVLKLNEFTFEYFGPDRKYYIGEIIAHKAHNFLLDTVLSIGIVGLICYCLLFGFCFWRVVRSPYRGLEVVAIVYLTFVMTWFESAQYTHLVWWSLSVGLISLTASEFKPTQEV
jgi:hypothetical protein